MRGRTGAWVGALAAVALLAGTPAWAGTASDAVIKAHTFKAVPSGQVVNGAARCPRGTRAVGGGFGTNGGAFFGAYSDRIDGPFATGGFTGTGTGDVVRRWKAIFYESPTATYNYKIFAVCSRQSDAKVEASSLSVDNGRTGGVAVLCPSGERALGGGLIADTPGDASGIQVLLNGPIKSGGTFPVAPDTGDIARGWLASAHNSTGATQKLKVIALCSADSRARAQVTPITVADGTDGGAIVPCPARSRATGGGLDLAHAVLSHNPVPFYEMLSTPTDGTGVGGTRTGDIPRDWYAAVSNQSGVSADFKIVAICEPH